MKGVCYMKIIEAPEWASELMHDAFDYMGFKERRGNVRIETIPTLIWKTHDKKSTSGLAKYGFRYFKAFSTKKRIKKPEIIIRAGTDEWEHKMVLLHEVAHHLCKWNVNHSETFWRKAWRLYHHYGLDHDKCLKREQRWSGCGLTYRKLFEEGEFAC